MGREVRRVPPNWEHPKINVSWRAERGELQPMYNKRYEDARQEWLDGLAAHEPGEHGGLDYWEYEGQPPDRDYYRPWKDEEATWFQVWETVSEGTPVTPPFATKDELVMYLATNGDWWDQRRIRDDPKEFRLLWGRYDAGWDIDAARAFVEAGWQPTLISRTTGEGSDR